MRGGVACLVVGPLVYAVNWLAQLRWEVNSHPLETMVRADPTRSIALLSIVSGVLLAPAAEELLFRGVLLGWLNRLWSRGPGPMPIDAQAADLAGVPAPDEVPTPRASPSSSPATLVPNLIASLLFAGIHWPQWPAPIPIFLLSLTLGLLYQRTGSLVAPFTLHALFNGISTLGLFLSIR